MPLQNSGGWLRRGLRDGIPIALGYFAVAFTLGIAAKNAGLTPFQAGLASFLNNASAGEFVGFTLIAAGASYVEMAVMQLITNARYLLMSFALSQKLPQHATTLQRLLVGYVVTDEIFGISMAVPGKLDPRYTCGAMLVAVPGWCIGTALGTAMGSILPIRLVSALSVGLYGMFLACFIPPARKSRVVAGLIAVCFGASYLVNTLPVFAGVSTSIKVIGLTLVLAGCAAVLFPVKEEEPEPAGAGEEADGNGT